MTEATHETDRMRVGAAPSPARCVPVMGHGDDGPVCRLMPSFARAQDLPFDLGNPSAPEAAHLVQIFVLIGVLPLAPSIIVMLTAFTRIVIVLSILRNALGMQSTPPNSVLIGLALFLSYFVMQPVLHASWHQGIAPMINGSVGPMEGLRATAAPFHTFRHAMRGPRMSGSFSTSPIC